MKKYYISILYIIHYRQMVLEKNGREWSGMGDKNSMTYLQTDLAYYTHVYIIMSLQNPQESVCLNPLRVAHQLRSKVIVASQFFDGVTLMPLPLAFRQYLHARADICLVVIISTC